MRPILARAAWCEVVRARRALLGDMPRIPQLTAFPQVDSSCGGGSVLVVLQYMNQFYAM